MLEQVSMQCPNCGGEIVLSEDKKHGKCSSCENEFIFNRVKTDEKISLLNQANFCRLRNDFEGAILAYTDLLKIDDTDSEIYWGLVLSSYGIEYVADPKTSKNIPTCRRIVNRSIFHDKNYLKALEYAANEQKNKYRQEAFVIDKLQESIMQKLNTEESYDVFICFRSSDDDNLPTEDRYVARRIYDELTKRGIKAFYSEITLKDRLGSEYEPIIYKALYTSKVMILVTTKHEYINSVWVRNEWARFRDRIHDENLKDASFAVFKDITRSQLPPIFRSQGVDLKKYPFGGYEIEIADALCLRFEKEKQSGQNAIEHEIIKNKTDATSFDSTNKQRNYDFDRSGHSQQNERQSAYGQHGYFYDKPHSGFKSSNNYQTNKENAKEQHNERASGGFSVDPNLTREQVNKDLSNLVREKHHYTRMRDKAQNAYDADRAAMKRMAEQRKQFNNEKEKLDRILNTPDFYKKKERQKTNRVIWLRLLATVFLCIFAAPLITKLGIVTGSIKALLTAFVIIVGVILIWHKQFTPINQKQIEKNHLIDTEREKQLREQIIQCETQLLNINRKFDKSKQVLEEIIDKIRECDDKIAEYLRTYDFAAKQLEKINTSIAQKVANVVSEGIIEISNGIDKGIAAVKDSFKK